VNLKLPHGRLATTALRSQRTGDLDEDALDTANFRENWDRKYTPKFRTSGRPMYLPR
jgi:hypothetical protein